MPSRRVLITGGCGFIGSHLVRRWLMRFPQDVVMNLDLLTYAGNSDNLADVVETWPQRYRFVHGDIADADLVQRLMQETDICLHVAAQTHVDRSIEGPGIFVHTNVLGTQTLLEAARLAHIDKFVLVSTDEVYGSLGETGYFTENSPLDPSSPYSASKAGGDMLAQSYWRTYQLPVCITRCSNNYGPYQYPEKMLPLFILQALAGQPLPVYGDGQNVRDWLHVVDHVEAIIRVAEAGQPGQVYNIGGNNEWRNLDLTRTLLQMLGQSESLIRFVADRPGHDRRYAIDSSKIRHELGWTPSIPFQQGLQDTVAWYQSNPVWVQRLRERSGATAATAALPAGRA
jgi:dTDP-glucose 4,6-dehydratase